MRGNDLVFAFPSLLIAIMITTVFGPSALNAIIAIGIFNIPVFARLTRGAALPLWDPRLHPVCAGFRQGAGADFGRAHPAQRGQISLIVQGHRSSFRSGFLPKAALSYVGPGGPSPPHPSWGRMLADSQTLIAIAAAHGDVSPVSPYS